MNGGVLPCEQEPRGGKARRVPVEGGVAKLNRCAGFHDQGLARLLEEGAGLASCDRFLDVGGYMGETLQVERVVPAESPIQGRCEQGNARGCFRDSSPLEGWSHGRFDNVVPGGQLEAGDRKGMFDALHAGRGKGVKGM